MPLNSSFLQISTGSGPPSPVNVSKCLAEQYLTNQAVSTPLLQIIATVLFTHTIHLDGSVTVESQQLGVTCDWVRVVRYLLNQVVLL